MKKTFRHRSDLPMLLPVIKHFNEKMHTQEFSAALPHLKPEKTPGANFICREFEVYAGAGLKS